jgi:hypothetical protein
MFVLLLLLEEGQEEKDEACGQHNIWRGVKIMKLHIIHYSSIPCPHVTCCL